MINKNNSVININSILVDIFKKYCDILDLYTLTDSGVIVSTKQEMEAAACKIRENVVNNLVMDFILENSNNVNDVLTTINKDIKWAIKNINIYGTLRQDIEEFLAKKLILKYILKYNKIKKIKLKFTNMNYLQFYKFLSVYYAYIFNLKKSFSANSLQTTLLQENASKNVDDIFNFHMTNVLENIIDTGKSNFIGNENEGLSNYSKKIIYIIYFILKSLEIYDVKNQVWMKGKV